MHRRHRHPAGKVGATGGHCDTGVWPPADGRRCEDRYRFTIHAHLAICGNGSHCQRLGDRPAGPGETAGEADSLG